MNLQLPELPKPYPGTPATAPQAEYRPFALSSLQGPAQNHLLAALPPADFERLTPELELVPMPAICV